jgi:Ran GTPase-activating protein (RanGAP) involved in mRNA processing and transport
LGDKLQSQVSLLLKSPAHCDVKELQTFAKELLAMPEHLIKRDAQKLCNRVVSIDQGGLKNPHLRKVYEILAGELPQGDTLTLVGKDGQAYRVSKAVAVTFSEPLRVAFASNEYQYQWRERGPLLVYPLTQYEDEVVEILQDFFHNNSIGKIHAGNLFSVFACAKELQIAQLEEACRSLLKAEFSEMITIEDVWGFYRWGEMHGELWINALCLDYLSEVPAEELSCLPLHYQWKGHTLPLIRMIRDRSIQVDFMPCGGISVAIKRVGDLAQTAQIFQAIQVKKIINHDYRVNAMPLLASLIPTCPTLTHLDLRWSIVKGCGLEQLKAALKGNKSLQVLDLHGSGLDLGGANSLLDILKDITSLVYLDLGNDKDGTPQARFVSSGMGEEGGKIFAAFLKAHPSLRYFNVSHNGLGDAGVAKIVEALIGNRVLMHLDISENDTLGVVVESLVKMFVGNSCLRTLKMKTFALTDQQAKTLAEGLRKNTTLEELDLSFNVIGDDGVKELAEACKSKKVPKLNMESNDVHSEGFRVFIQSLCTKMAMQLLFKHNRVDDDGADAVVEAINKGWNISKIDLAGNNITDRGIACILQALESHPKPIELNFYNDAAQRVR